MSFRSERTAGGQRIRVDTADRRILARTADVRSARGGRGLAGAPTEISAGLIDRFVSLLAVGNAYYNGFLIAASGWLFARCRDRCGA